MIYINCSIRIFVSIVFIMILNISPSISQSTYTVGAKTTADKATAIVTKDLKTQGIKRIKELITLSKKNNGNELSKQFASYSTSNLQSSEEKTQYASPEEQDSDDELMIRRINFFINLEKDCKKMKKVFVGYMQNDDEPIGHAFRLTIPAVRKKGDFSCMHYTVSFRRAHNGDLLVTEWFAMPGNSDCQ